MFLGPACCPAASCSWCTLISPMHSVYFICSRSMSSKRFSSAAICMCRHAAKGPCLCFRLLHFGLADLKKLLSFLESNLLRKAQRKPEQPGINPRSYVYETKAGVVINPQRTSGQLKTRKGHWAMNRRREAYSFLYDCRSHSGKLPSGKSSATGMLGGTVCSLKLPCF